MKAHLLYRDRDFDWMWARHAVEEREANRHGMQYRGEEFDRRAGLPWNEQILTADLGLDALFSVMAGDDDCIFTVARKTILASVKGDLETIRYRQGILQDCLNNPAVVRELYALTIATLEKKTGHFLGGALSRYPDWVLRDAVELMEKLLDSLQQLRSIADQHAPKFTSEGWAAFFAMIRRDLGDDYLIAVKRHLETLKFRGSPVLLSAELGKANKGSDYLLHRFAPLKRSWRSWLFWWEWFFGHRISPYSFTLHPRDESGARALGVLKDRGIALVADALGQSAVHVRDFFNMLRAELAFYVGCLNLHERLQARSEPLCLPLPVAAEDRQLSFQGLYDVGLALTIDRRVVGNDAGADGKGLVVVTGANTGGKSTFLRSLGLAQLMMQSGMFVPAEAYRSSLCDGLFTHYKREEDAAMDSGKFDEELRRMNDIVDHVSPYSMVLFNESFAATNEREGSEIARQIMTALLDQSIRVACVTHLYELAHGFYERRRGDALFLCAERQRTFKLIEGEPLPTSFGPDLYHTIFGAEAGGAWNSVATETCRYTRVIAPKLSSPRFR